jgi:RNA polymerase sigma factor (sigma-70 family)
MNLTTSRLTQVFVELSGEPDGSLVTSFLRGNQAAFRELVERHGPLVFGVCNRILRHHQDAEDAFQAVFVVLAHRAAIVRRHDALGSWLYGVATRVALKARALRTRRQASEQSIPDLDHSYDQKFSHDYAELVGWAIQQLPEIYRAAVVVCDLEGLSRKDAARRLGWTEGTLSGRLARARKLLEKRLQEAGIALPATGLAAVLGTDSTIRAGTSDAVMKLISTPSSVPPSVAALTQGVVRTMFASKLKTATAAVLLVCTVGFCTWRIGADDGPGIEQPGGKAIAPPAHPKSQSSDSEKPPVDPTEDEREQAARERERIVNERQELNRLQRAVAEAEEAEKKALDEFTVAQANLHLAKAKRAKAEKEVEAWKPGSSPASEVTIHVRPLLSEEKSLTLDVGRVQTVLEGLAYAAKETPIKPDETSVWVARGKELLPVDLAAITEKADNKTNYKLQAGDQLFVQINVKK